MRNITGCLYNSVFELENMPTVDSMSCLCREKHIVLAMMVQFFADKIKHELVMGSLAAVNVDSCAGPTYVVPFVSSLLLKDVKATGTADARPFYWNEILIEEGKPPKAHESSSHMTTARKGAWTPSTVV